MTQFLPSSMPAARYYKRTGWAFLALAAVLALLPIIIQADQFGTIFAEGLAALCALRGILRLRTAKHSQPDAVVYQHSQVLAQPPSDQARYYRRMIPIMGLAALLGALFFAYELSPLDRGEVEAARTWWPIALLYETFGFWPAVLSFPALCALVIVTWLRRLHHLSPHTGSGSQKPTSA